MGESMRLFIAIDLPEKAKGILGSLSHKLFDDISGRAVRPVKTGAMHLTLKFLGDVEGAKVDQIDKTLQKAIEKRPPFILIASSIGAFPSEVKPRVIWLGLEGEVKTLHGLHKDIEDALSLIGFPKEKKMYHPHLTLARIKRDASTTDIQRIRRRMREVEANDVFGWRIRHFTLYRSHLKPAGPVYQQLASFDLE